MTRRGSGHSPEAHLFECGCRDVTKSARPGATISVAFSPLTRSGPVPYFPSSTPSSKLGPRSSHPRRSVTSSGLGDCRGRARFSFGGSPRGSRRTPSDFASTVLHCGLWSCQPPPGPARAKGVWSGMRHVGRIGRKIGPEWTRADAAIGHSCAVPFMMSTISVGVRRSRTWRKNRCHSSRRSSGV